MSLGKPTCLSGSSILGFKHFYSPLTVPWLDGPLKAPLQSMVLCFLSFHFQAQTSHDGPATSGEDMEWHFLRDLLSHLLQRDRREDLHWQLGIPCHLTDERWWNNDETVRKDAEGALLKTTWPDWNQPVQMQWTQSTRNCLIFWKLAMGGVEFHLPEGSDNSYIGWMVWWFCGKDCCSIHFAGNCCLLCGLIVVKNSGFLPAFDKVQHGWASNFGVWKTVPTVSMTVCFQDWYSPHRRFSCWSTEQIWQSSGMNLPLLQAKLDLNCRKFLYCAEASYQIMMAFQIMLGCQ